MNDSLFLLTSNMSSDHQRIQQIKAHINQLLAELHLIQSSTKELLPFNLTINSQITTISEKKSRLNCPCPFLAAKSNGQAILHSTTVDPCSKNPSRKSTKKNLRLCSSTPERFVLAAQATSTPKRSLHSNHFQTSTPRRSQMPSNNLIPLKRLLYNHPKKSPYRHSVLPFSKRVKHLAPIDENPQWI